MKAYPHVYRVGALGSATGTVLVTSADVPDISTAPPPEFDGPGGVWSPETLFIASIADCFILTFRGVSRAAHFEWEKLEAHVEGTLERVAGVTQFTRYVTRAILTVTPSSDHVKAKELLERAEKVCLITNSLRGERLLETIVNTMAG
ncbi:MAG: OsmC family protein [Steroidobacteraceae bacterium]